MTYRLDKTRFKRQTVKEADHQLQYWLGKTVEERLRAAWYLTCRAYGYDPEDPPTMDKQRFESRTRE